MAQNKNPWKSGTVVDCFDDVDVCVVTICLPCLVFSENRSVLHGGPSNPHDEGIDPCLIYCLIMSLSACTLQCLYAYSTRTDIRRKYNLEEEPCDDCMTHICCHCCALCQEHRELRMYPVTSWPPPASHHPSGGSIQTQSAMPGRRRRRAQAGPPQVAPPAPQSSFDAYAPASPATGSSVPFNYAAYPNPYQRYGGPAAAAGGPPYGMPASPGDASQYGVAPGGGGMSPFGMPGGAGGSYIPMNQFPASPPRPGPPQPLVFETHRMSNPYGTGILPGIPAHVFQVPKFPDMRRGGSVYSEGRSDDNSAGQQPQQQQQQQHPHHHQR